jgi:3-phenylpropionate/cinnamic acid dioxygenase small subunit
VTIPHDEAAAFLYQEARLLDEGRLQEWLDLFAPDSLYWLPITQAKRAERDTSLIYDGDVRRRERVYRLTSTPLPSQNPPSRTLHVVSNVEVDDNGAAGRAVVRSTQVVFELRTGDHTQRGLGTQHTFAGHCTHELVQIDGQWRIALKKLVLLNRDVAVPNLTFML